MEQAAEILVIIVSAVLTLFLILTIILMVFLIKTVKKIRQVAEKAESVMGDVSAATHAFKNVAGPVAFGKFFINIAETVFNRTRKGGKN